MKALLNAGQFQDTLQKLSRELSEAFAPDAEIVLIGLRRRGVPLAERLAALLESQGGRRVQVGSLDISFYRDDLSRAAEHPTIGVTELPFDLDDRIVVLVDDVLFTGRTVRAALSALLEYARPRRIALLVMVDRGCRELPIQADWSGLKIETGPSDDVRVCVEEIDGQDAVYLMEAPHHA